MNGFLGAIICATALMLMFIFAEIQANPATTRECGVYQGLEIITIAAFFWPITYGHYRASIVTWIIFGSGVAWLIVALLRRSKHVRQYDF